MEGGCLAINSRASEVLYMILRGVGGKKWQYPSATDRCTTNNNYLYIMHVKQMTTAGLCIKALLLAIIILLY